MQHFNIFAYCFLQRGLRCASAFKLMMGDEVSIKADFVAALSVTLEIENDLYSSPLEIESVSLTLDKASELANALPIRGGLN